MSKERLTVFCLFFACVLHANVLLLAETVSDISSVKKSFPDQILEQTELIAQPNGDLLKRYLLIDIATSSIKKLYSQQKSESSVLVAQKILYGFLYANNNCYMTNSVGKWELVYCPKFSILDQKWYSQFFIINLPFVEQEINRLNSALTVAHKGQDALQIDEASNRLALFQKKLLDPTQKHILLTVFSGQYKDNIDYDIEVDHAVVKKVTGKLHGKVVYSLENRGVYKASFDIKKEDIVESDYAKVKSYTDQQIAKYSKIPNWGFIGLSYIKKEGKFLVSAVTDKSPANKAGVEIGDQILYVNNKTLDGLDEKAVLALFQSNSSFSLKLKKYSGAIQEVTLQKALIFE